MAVDFLVSIAAKIGECLVAPVGRQLGYLLCYKSNIENFRSQVDNLGNTKDGVQILVDAAERNGEVILEDVKAWLESVDRLTEESREFSDDVLKESEWCFNGHCLDLKLRYQRSRRAKKQAAVADGLKQRRQQFHEISSRAPPLTIGSIPTEEVAEAFESRTSTTKEIMEELRDDRINMIGIYGIGGVGKTTLVKEVAEQAKDAKLFDEIVMAVVSQTPDTKRIQGEIADMLGLKFQEETVLGRAHALSKRLETKKILVILDDLWDRVKLETIGIPFGAQHKGCKILLTSRNKGVCNMMDTGKNFLIGALPEQEARNLFRKMAGVSVDSLDPPTVADEVAKECAGLPLAIVTVARALKNRDPSDWEDTLRRLRKSDPDKRAFDSLELSYNYLEGEEAQSFFLLCCLYPEDHNIAIQDLLRYGMGLGLFENVDTVKDATVRAHKLASDLKSSCLLLDGRDNEYAKMHDVVRDVAIKIASKDKHVFLVRVGPGETVLPNRDAFKRYTAISITCDDIDELPDGLECPELQILLLACRHPSLQFPDSFFSGMTSLKVLDMSGMDNLSPPPSLRCLENLQTLCLYNCSLEGLSVIGELKNLEFLSIGGSGFVELPKEIGMLTQLRLLDLTGCDGLVVIPPDVIRGLSKLEELYMYAFDGWEIERQDNIGRRNASLGELKHLRRLTTLEINVPDANCLPEDLLFKKLSSFKISIGTSFEYFDGFSSYSKSLKLKLSSPSFIKDGVKVLMKEVEYLHLEEMKGLKNVHLDTEGFRKLKCLIVKECAEMEYMLDATERDMPRDAFPVLEKLELYNLAKLKGICQGQHVCFRNLRVVEVGGCKGLKNVFSHSMAKDLSKLVEVLEVGWCERMEEIFGNEREAAAEAMDSIVFPHLHSLALRSLPNLRNFRSKMKLLDSIGNTDEPLFDNKVSFPRLGQLQLRDLPELTHVFSPSVARGLVQLQTLKIESCEMLKEIIAEQGEAEDETINAKINVFPQLQDLTLSILPNLVTFSRGSYILETTSLVKLEINGCDKIKAFDAFGGLITQNLEINNDAAGLEAEKECDLSLFSEKVSFPILKELTIKATDNLNAIWHPKLQAGSFCQLRVLKVQSCHKLMNVVPYNLLKALKHLEEVSVAECNSVEIIFEIEGVVVKDKEIDVMGTAQVILSQLEILELRGLPKLLTSKHPIVQINDEEYKETPSQEGNSFVPVGPLFNQWVAFTNLVDLQIWDIENLQEIFHSQLAAESFYQLTYLEVGRCHKLSKIASSNLLSRLKNLQRFDVEECNSMEVIFKVDGVVGEGQATTLPSLCQVGLRNLPNLRIFSSGDYNFTLPSLEGIYLEECPKMQTFSSGFISTPKLNAVTVGYNYEEIWKDDLNSTVQQCWIQKKMEEEEEDEDDDDDGDGDGDEEEERGRVNKSEEAGKVEGKWERGETSSSQAIQHEISRISRRSIIQLASLERIIQDLLHS